MDLWSEGWPVSGRGKMGAGEGGSTFQAIEGRW